MPSFEYQALTEAGGSRKGFLEADSERHARQLLRDEGLLPLAVNQSRANKRSALSLRARRRVSARLVSLFARQLATLVDSGIPLADALAACAEQSSSIALRKIILDVRSQVREGHTLADSLARHPATFSQIFVSLVKAGEHSGDLGAVLNRLADYLEESQHLRATLRQGMIYPMILTWVAIGVVGLLMSVVVPKVIAQFDHVQQQLPFLTRLLISVSDSVRDNGVICLGLILIAGFCWRYWNNDDSRRARWHRFQLMCPVLGNLVMNINSARLLRALSILISSGVPVLEALKVGRDTLSNLELKKRVAEGIDELAAGRTLHHALAARNIVSPIALYMIANGEKSGSLDQMLERAATSQERQLTDQFKLFLSLFEPALIIVLGGIVLVIVLAILLPILQLNNLTPM